MQFNSYKKINFQNVVDLLIKLFLVSFFSEDDV